MNSWAHPLEETDYMWGGTMGVMFDEDTNPQPLPIITTDRRSLGFSGGNDDVLCADEFIPACALSVSGTESPSTAPEDVFFGLSWSDKGNEDEVETFSEQTVSLPPLPTVLGQPLVTETVVHVKEERACKEPHEPTSTTRPWLPLEQAGLRDSKSTRVKGVSSKVRPEKRKPSLTVPGSKKRNVKDSSSRPRRRARPGGWDTEERRRVRKLKLSQHSRRVLRGAFAELRSMVASSSTGQGDILEDTLFRMKALKARLAQLEAEYASKAKAGCGAGGEQAGGDADSGGQDAGRPVKPATECTQVAARLPSLASSTAFRGACAAMMVGDVGGAVVDCNEPFLCALGYRSRAEALGTSRHCTSVLHPDDVPQVARFVCRLLSTPPGTPAVVKERTLHRAGHFICVSAVAWRIRSLDERDRRYREVDATALSCQDKWVCLLFPHSDSNPGGSTQRLLPAAPRSSPAGAGAAAAGVNLFAEACPTARALRRQKDRCCGPAGSRRPHAPFAVPVPVQREESPLSGESKAQEDAPGPESACCCKGKRGKDQDREVRAPRAPSGSPFALPADVVVAARRALQAAVGS